MTRRRLAVVTAGLSQPSSSRLLADRLAVSAQRALDVSGTEATIDVIELRDHAHDLTNNLLTGFASPRLRAAIDLVVDADGLIAVTPIFTAVGDVDTGLTVRIDRASGELARLVDAERGRERTDPFDSPTSFAELLVAS